LGPKKDNDSSKVKRKNTNIIIDVKKYIIAKHENGVRAKRQKKEPPSKR
jgi:hypothetical protein